MEYARKVEIPFYFHELSAEIKENFALIFQLSQRMRPGRVTVLDTICEDEFIHRYDDYCHFVNEQTQHGDKQVKRS